MENLEDRAADRLFARYALDTDLAFAIPRLNAIRTVDHVETDGERIDDLLDEAALFYMKARGIGHEEARQMLIEAFVKEALEPIGPAALREHLLSRLARRLAMLEE